MNNINCPKCGTPFEGLKLCPKCGTNILEILAIYQALNLSCGNAVEEPEALGVQFASGMDEGYQQKYLCKSDFAKSKPLKSLKSKVMKIKNRNVKFPDSDDLEAAIKMAEYYRNKYPGKMGKQINLLIMRQVAKSAIAGFLAGVSGPLSILFPPRLDILCIQNKMAVAIAHIRGYDTKSEKVKAFVNILIAGSDVRKTLKEAGVEIGDEDKIKLSKLLIKITSGVITKINWPVACKMVAQIKKFGAAKMVPIISGIIEGLINMFWTIGVAISANKYFENEPRKD